MTGRALAFVLTAACVAAGVLPPVASGRNQALRAALSGFVCRTAGNPLNRYIEVTAVMRPVATTEQMQLRFELLQRTPGHWFHDLYGGDLGHWREPNPPTLGQNPGDTWIVQKPVANLAAPAVYRFRVTFRWILRSGVRITATRVSPRCVQPQ